MTEQCNWLDKKKCRSRGFNIEPIEKFLIEKGGYAKPIGLALQKEYGKRISGKEWFEKGKKESGIDILSLGVTNQLKRINEDLKKKIRKETEKHPK